MYRNMEIKDSDEEYVQIFVSASSSMIKSATTSAF